MDRRSDEPDVSACTFDDVMSFYRACGELDAEVKINDFGDGDRSLEVWTPDRSVAYVMTPAPCSTASAGVDCDHSCVALVETSSAGWGGPRRRVHFVGVAKFFFDIFVKALVDRGTEKRLAWAGRRRPPAQITKLAELLGFDDEVDEAFERCGPWSDAEATRDDEEARRNAAEMMRRRRTDPAESPAMIVPATPAQCR